MLKMKIIFMNLSSIGTNLCTGSENSKKQWYFAKNNIYNKDKLGTGSFISKDGCRVLIGNFEVAIWQPGKKVQITK